MCPQLGKPSNKPRPVVKETAVGMSPGSPVIVQSSDGGISTFSVLSKGPLKTMRHLLVSYLHCATLLSSFLCELMKELRFEF